MSTRYRLPSGLILLVLVGACDDPVSPVELMLLAGTWDYSEAIAVGRGMACNASGMLTIHPSDTGLRGQIAQTGTCTLSGIAGVFRHPRPLGTDTLTRGQVSGRRVSFQALECRFEGATSGALGLRSRRMSGTVSCVLPAGGNGPVVAAGSWEAVR